MTADDHAALTSRRQSIGIANGSFEAPDARNWKTAYASISRVSVPTIGSYAARYAPSDWLNNYLGQRHTRWFQTTSSMMFQFQHRSVSSGVTGNVVGQVWTRQYNYGMNGSCSDYPSGSANIPNLTANERQLVQSLVLRGSSSQATSTTYNTNSLWVTGIPRGNADSFEFEVRIVSNAKTSSNQPAPIYLDNARVWD